MRSVPLLPSLLCLLRALSTAWAFQLVPYANLKTACRDTKDSRPAAHELRCIGKHRGTSMVPSWDAHLLLVPTRTGSRDNLICVKSKQLRSLCAHRQFVCSVSDAGLQLFSSFSDILGIVRQQPHPTASSRWDEGRCQRAVTHVRPVDTALALAAAALSPNCVKMGRSCSKAPSSLRSKLSGCLVSAPADCVCTLSSLRPAAHTGLSCSAAGRPRHFGCPRIVSPPSRLRSRSRTGAAYKERGHR